jgi:nucleotide-binding universal stress UspA family protein
MKKILIAYDGSDAAKKALEMAIKCVHPPDEAFLLTVIPAELIESSFTKMLLPTLDLGSMVQSGTFKEKAMKTIEKVSEQIKGKVKKVVSLVETGDAADEILMSAKKYDIDLIIVGYKGYGKEGRFLIGSVTDKIVRHASCSVMVVR